MRPQKLWPIPLLAWLLVVVLSAGLWGSGVPGFWLARSVQADPLAHGAMFWSGSCHGLVCRLCPRQCFLPEGLKGWCRTRVTSGDRLFTLVYGRPAAVHVDPIEKKPVFHLLPGSTAFSLATAGCNLRCDFCQNWTLSQAEPESLPNEPLLPEQVVALAKQSQSRSIAYTYSEPVIFYEYMVDTARLARAAGLYNVMITAGYILPEPLRYLLPWLDVMKVDLKGMDEAYYRRVVGGELHYVLEALEVAAHSGVQLELVNLMVPGQNDSEGEVLRLSRWVHDRLGAETPLFFSRFVPGFRMPNLPETPALSLQHARELARSEGLKYVYLGNLAGDEGENTYCPLCGLLLVRRAGYAVLSQVIRKGRCPRCGERIPGIWEDRR